MDNRTPIKQPVPSALPLLAEVPLRRFEPVAGAARMAFFLVGLVALGNWLLWEQLPGAGSGLYALCLGGAILLNRPGLKSSPRHAVMLTLLVLAAVQTAIRPSMSNALVSWGLLLVLAGDTGLPGLKPVWLRWLRVCVAAVEFVAAWVVFIRSLYCRMADGGGRIGGQVARVWNASWLALLLAAGFGGLLVSGNAVLKNVFEKLYTWLIRAEWDIPMPGFVQILFWGALATAALVLLLPRAGKWTGARCRQEVPSFEVKDPQLARLRSLLAFAAVNVIFLLVNSLDVFVLWLDGRLPEGVGYASYLHSGVWSLIFAVLLSAVVMTLIFQQDASVSHSRWLKGLALVWIGQNLFLVLGVVLRLALYIDAYTYLTPRRVYVVVFLILVVAGYGLLTRHIFFRRSLKQLLLGNVLAVFVLFYLLQFVNVPRLVADCDYRKWLENPEVNIVQSDLEGVLGVEMIPLLIRVAESGLEVEAVSDAQNELRFGDEFKSYDAWWLLADWQSWTLHRAQLASLLEAYREENLN
ncbi:DUF4173 domain-containing protein [Ruficoccus amylovorans]|uniref:DUF4173 domain-containing protein n=1 Tax=Ruficoccus amylovorans TaxID=1804625 RepID=A0A842HE95_9BACT|nr:DUF4173 domain-containing protein [Ruficoccus amylovorans]MBC2594358.1 DUF4173 domain-containing protein [Ruficoccus amylovorans]